MPARSKKQARWARAGCPGSSISHEKCEEFVPHGKGSYKELPEKRERPKRSKRGS